MATYEQVADFRSTWLAQVNGANKGNSGIRWQCGKTITSGGVTWINRIEAVFDLMSSAEGTLPTPLRASYASITAVELVLTVRGTHSCFAKGSSPKMYAKGLSDYDNSGSGNTQSGECTVAGSAHGDVYPGFATTATHQVSWSGTPLVGDTVTLDITNIYKDWFDDGVGRPPYFTVMLVAQDETDTTQAIAFDGQDGPNPAILRFTYSTNSTPTIPSPDTYRYPVGGARRVGGSGSLSMGFTFHDDDPADQAAGPAAIELYVDDDPAFGSPLYHSTSLVPSFYDDPKVDVLAIPVVGQVRGTTYYWKYKVQDANGAWSAFSSTESYKYNQLPVGTKVRPT